MPTKEQLQVISDINKKVGKVMAGQQTQTDIPQVIETQNTVMPASKTLRVQGQSSSPVKMSVVNVTKKQIYDVM